MILFIVVFIVLIFECPLQGFASLEKSLSHPSCKVVNHPMIYEPWFGIIYRILKNSHNHFSSIL